MIRVLSIARYKTTLNRVFRINMKRGLLLLKSHQFLCEANNTLMKNLFRTEKLPDDIDRIQRLVTIFQKMTDNCKWHTGYKIDGLSKFETFNRVHTIPLAVNVLECLSELMTGPCVENQKLIYQFIYDRYNGILQRYDFDTESELYKLKVFILIINLKFV